MVTDVRRCRAATVGFGGLVPKPRDVAPTSGAFVLAGDTTVHIDGDADARDAVRLLQETVHAVAGIRLPVTPRRPGRTCFAFVTAGAYEDLGEEGYELRISPSEVTVVAGRHDAFIWAVQTICQLVQLTSACPQHETDEFCMPTGVVRDVPRYEWRGVMLDVARHFFSVADVEAVVDLASAYKLNRVHLHLTDDQGWRLHIRSYPDLTAIGAAAQVGGGPGGYFSQDQYRSICEHAGRRGVTIVPEIDVPGHTNAALASIPALNCDGIAPDLYTGVEVGFSSLCIESHETYRWLDRVIAEVADLTPGPWIHIGADEAHATSWSDHARFVCRAVETVSAHGKVAVGWEEAGWASLPSDVIVQHWNSPLPVIESAKRGARIIMSPASRCYLDLKYDEHSPAGQTWAGYLDTKRAYDWDPGNLIDGVEDAQVVGVEAPIWTEFITDRTQLERMMLPRLPALAEVGWSNQVDREWADFAARIGGHTPLWDDWGLSWTAGQV